MLITIFVPSPPDKIVLIRDFVFVMSTTKIRLTRRELTRAHMFAWRNIRKPKTKVGQVLLEIVEMVEERRDGLPFYSPRKSLLRPYTEDGQYWDLYFEHIRTISYLKRKRLIRIEKNGNQLRIALTDE